MPFAQPYRPNFPMTALSISKYYSSPRNTILLMNAVKQALRLFQVPVLGIPRDHSIPRTNILQGIISNNSSTIFLAINGKDEKGKFDEQVEDKGVKLLIDPKVLMHVIGTKMDFVDDKLRSEFIAINPNSKGQCGCGESFKTTSSSDVAKKKRAAERRGITCAWMNH